MAVILSRKSGGGSGGGAPSGPAGGDLAGTYPNPTLAAGTVLFDAYAQYSCTLAANTANGDSSSGSFLQYPLTTEDFDPAGIGSLAANQVTLAAGTYYADGWLTVFQTNARYMAMLYNATDATAIASGRSGYAAGTDRNQNEYATVRVRFTLAGAKAIELRYRVQAGLAAEGLGTQANFGVSELYAQLTIYREA